MSNYNIKALEKVESKTKIYLIIIAILMIILCVNNKWFIIPSVVFHLCKIFLFEYESISISFFFYN